MGRRTRGATRPSTTSTRSIGCTSSSRGTACGRPTSSRYPVARDPRSADVLRALLARGDCEIGAHHHAWETPPCEPADVDRHPYALSLPLDQFDAQLASLTDGDHATPSASRPVSYRSGRFGFSAAHVSSLERAGYLVDSSVAPLFYEAHKQRTGLRRRAAHAVFPLLRRRDAAGHERRARAADLGGAQSPRAGVVERWYGARAVALHDQARAAAAADRARPLAAAVVQLGRRHDRARRARSSTRGVADPQPALSLERGHRRRQSRTTGRKASSTRSSIGSGAFLTFATRELGAEPMTFAEFRDRFVQRAVRSAASA